MGTFLSRGSEKSPFLCFLQPVETTAFPASGPFSVFRASVHGPSSPPAAACVTHGSPCYFCGRQ